MTQIARLYGGSMYDLAAEEQLTDTVLEQMQTIRQLFRENPDYVKLLSEPSIPKEERTKLLDTAFGTEAERYLVNFLKLLCERGILGEYSGCCEEFIRRYNVDHNIATAVVTSAVALTDEQMAALKDKLEKISGKTVTLKTAGLLCAMAQCGFLIPADERSEVCVFDEFLVDIGDEQSIEQSLSTFSGHMKKITGILELAMPHTLVLLDELGAGTNPAEGAALAVAIIEELRRRGVLLMATTHYAELKVFALETKGVVNASCEFDLETLRPTYKLSVGVPGKSNAFLISEKLGIPSRVIEAAQQHLSAEDKRLDAVLGQLDDLKLQLKESQNEVEQLRNEASHQLEAARKKRDELIQQGENELEAARAKARTLAQQVETQAYALTDELRQLQKDERMSAQQKAQRAREIAKKETEKLFAGTEVVHNPVKEFVPLKDVKVGQEVCIAELNQLATVLALPDKNGDVLVRAGIIKTKVPLKGLKQPEKLVKEPTVPKTKAQQRYSRLTGDTNRPNGRVERVQRTAKMECNLLGLTVDEALSEVDSFIDRAILNGQTVVYLIHGNGTGALRTAIHKHLRGNRMVKSFRLGRYGEGESGVTVVELK